jgi:DNA-binding MarR family transcriptional regulator
MERHLTTPPAKKHSPGELCAAGPLSVSELPERIGLSLSSASATVIELADAGLIERAEDPADRRRTIVQISRRQRLPPDGHRAEPNLRSLASA